ncbi:hypothetical protein [Streptomyces sp. bgisy027]|uniref:hypothetical protein n=1 Tax=Streptomyces sp. bgisy027 TaxID=3413770 RepID=UPI003D707CFC
MVQADRDTLIRRRYVHRIRLDSEGTARRVRIGTEAFARRTEWFGLDECVMTERGLTTPAVERFVKARTMAPPARWPAAKTRKGPDVEARAQVLLRRLASARNVESVVVVNRVCREIADLTGAISATRTDLNDVVRDAHQWLQDQAGVRRELFARLDEAVTARNSRQARELLTRANATAAHDRTEAEERIAGAAADFVAEQARAQATADAERAAERAEEEMADLTARAAFETVRRVLREHGARRHERGLSLSPATPSTAPHVQGDAAQSGAVARRGRGQGRHTRHRVPAPGDRPLDKARRAHTVCRARTDGSCIAQQEGSDVAEVPRGRGHAGHLSSPSGHRAI